MRQICLYTHAEPPQNINIVMMSINAPLMMTCPTRVHARGPLDHIGQTWLGHLLHICMINFDGSHTQMGSLCPAKKTTSIIMTASEMVRRVTPPMKAPAPISAKAPGSSQAQALGLRKTPGGALHTKQPVICISCDVVSLSSEPRSWMSECQPHGQYSQKQNRISACCELEVQGAMKLAQLWRVHMCSGVRERACERGGGGTMQTSEPFRSAFSPQSPEAACLIGSQPCGSNKMSCSSSAACGEMVIQTTAL